jgi:pantoate--beta-alanine ligase
VTVPAVVEPTIAGLRARLDAARRDGARIGFVPTMGALHDGHLALVRAARELADVVVVSIFVNPLQFGPTEDFARYPRDLERDRGLACGAGADVIFAPAVEEMYPSWPMATTVSVAGVSAPMEGAKRPGHFDGVSTVVAKLFSIVGPCRAVFGEKDFQQLAVVRRMTADLSLPVEVIGHPTVREPDGLAMSSRNVYLDPAQRATAPVLHAALVAGRDAIAAGERDPAAVRARVRGMITAADGVELDYAEVVDAATLQPCDPLTGEVRLLVAARLGTTRLIDNVGITVEA